MPPEPAVHPSNETLIAFGIGKIDEAAADAVLQHLEVCVDCKRRVAEMSADSFVGRLREAAGGRDGTPEPQKSLSGLSRSVRPAAVVALPPELANSQQYEGVRELGRGGMGVVYLATNKLMDRPEVLKVLNKAFLDRPGAAERFLREIRSAAKLQHPNVVAAYSALQLGELLVFAMEYVDGEDLAQLVETHGPVPVANACYYAYQAALGLQHAHEREMVHRDIKPSNLILTKSGGKSMVKILDFGLAKATSEKGTDPGLTGEGKMMGTPNYMAPEQARNATKADIRADIYSLGASLYHLLAGRVPFTGESMYEVLRHHEATEATPLNLVRPEVPAELAAVVAKMMTKEAGKRYQTPGDVAKALTPFIKPGVKSSPQTPPAAQTAKPTTTTPVVAHPVSPPPPPTDNVWETIPATAPSVRTRAAQAPPATRTDRPAKRVWVWPLIAVGVVCVGLLAALAGGVFKVRTANGVIVVENVPDDAVVELDGGVVTVARDGKTMTIQEVKDGDHTVKVTAGGLELLSRNVSVKLGDTPVRVRYEPKVAAAEPKVPAKDPKAAPTFPVADRLTEIDYAKKGEKYLLKATGLGAGGGNVCEVPKEFALEVVGRLRNGQQSGWGVNITGWPRKEPPFHGIWVRLTGAGEVAVCRGMFETDKNRLADNVKPIKHSAIKIGDESNRLLVVYRNRVLRVYVNGVEVIDPVGLDREIAPGTVAITVDRKDEPVSELEVDKLTVWNPKNLSAEKVQPPQLVVTHSANPTIESKEPAPKTSQPSGVPSGERKATIRRGDWRIVGNELHQKSEDSGGALLLFGDPTWKDINFEAAVRHNGGTAQ